MTRVLFIAPLVVLIFYPVYFFFLKSPPPLPDIDLNQWWGPADAKSSQDTRILPFKVNFSKAMINDLKERLNRSTTFTPALEGVGFQYGFNIGEIGKWIKYWRQQYPFTERETFLNQLHQFKTNVQGLDIHFIRVTPKVPPGVEVVPLLLLHGWPGSVREFYETIPLITAVSKDRDFAVEVIAPSLPGYGFSSAAVRPGLGGREVAVVLRNLMHRLGYMKFYVQGGDWGSIIGTNMATIFPDEVLGFHTNMPGTFDIKATLLTLIGSFFPSLVVDPELADRIYPLSEKYAFMLEESGYFHIQATKPDTVGIALSDSPIGLLAYVLEKFSTGTRRSHRTLSDGGLAFRWTPEKLIDNLMMYWSSNSMTSAMRLYAESVNKDRREVLLDSIPTSVPTYLTQAKHEITYFSPTLLQFKFSNIIGESVLDDGGHFLAFELPEVFAKEVLKAVTAFRKLGAKKTEL